MKASTGFALIPAMLYLISLDVLELEAHAAGGVPLWTNYYGQTGIAVDMAVDRAGNAVVTGFDYETIFPDLVTIKYSSDGLPLWTNRYNGPGSSDDQPKALAIDDTGNVFVIGTTGILGEPGDYLTLACSSDGAPLWMNRYNGTGNNRDSARAVAVDSSGKGSLPDRPSPWPLRITPRSRTRNQACRCGPISIMDRLTARMALSPSRSTAAGKCS